MDQEATTRFRPKGSSERRQGLEKARRILAPFMEGKPSMADELIAERRAEAAAQERESNS
jgi:hypothetical protein